MWKRKTRAEDSIIELPIPCAKWVTVWEPGYWEVSTEGVREGTGLLNSGLTVDHLGYTWELPGRWMHQKTRPNKWAVWNSRRNAWWAPTGDAPCAGLLEELYFLNAGDPSHLQLLPPCSGKPYRYKLVGVPPLGSELLADYDW